MNTAFQWVVPPDILIRGIEKYGHRALVAVQAVANYWGQMVQDEARTNAPWEDRTGNARGGLFFAVDGFDLGTLIGEVTPDANHYMDEVEIESGSKDTLIITLGHTVYYGKFLELSNGGKYAIIMSTIETNLPALEQMLRDTLR